MNLSAVILAAGKGVRMQSALPKVVHKAAGVPMILHIVRAVKAAGIQDIHVVVGHGRETVQEILEKESVQFVIQESQLGTGHALQQAEKNIDSDHCVLVLSGDTPLLQSHTLRAIIDTHLQQNAAATILSAEVQKPQGYGRIVRAATGDFNKIVEEKDASIEEKMIQEINSGIYCFNAGEVFSALGQINTNNAQQEYYLTDVLGLMKLEGKRVSVVTAKDAEEILGVNDRVQLAYVESVLRQKKNKELMQKGVHIIDPGSTFIDIEVNIQQDTVILPFTLIEGRTDIGGQCEIGPYTRITNSWIGNNVIIESSRVNEARIADHCTIGPFAYLRPQTILQEAVKVGDFVEIKKSNIGPRSKVPHLSYVGDAQLGSGVNIGAGTITCNYDGKHKFETIIQDQAFIGSNTNLVAPVVIGEGAVTGAGSTIAQDVPPKNLAIERAQQRNIPNWANKNSIED